MPRLNSLKKNVYKLCTYLRKTILLEVYKYVISFIFLNFLIFKTNFLGVTLKILTLLKLSDLFFTDAVDFFFDFLLNLFQTLNTTWTPHLDMYFYYLDYPIFVFSGFTFCISSFISFFFLNFLGFRGFFILNWALLSFFWLSCIPYLNFFFKDNGFYYINLGRWLSVDAQSLFFFDFWIDNISFSFMFLTLSISIFVYSFTFSYFRYEPLVDRLLAFLNLFIISMVFLVTAGNLISIFLGWELIGLTSFFLINFWVNKISTLKAAFKAFSFNKLSDFFLMLSIILIYNSYYTVDVLSLINQTNILSVKKIYINFIFLVNINDVISLCFLLSAFIKSAQFGFHIWLPDSMEAPVPASALIHSATLVSAGIFLLLRFNFFFYNNLFINFIICFVGAITAFYGGLISMYQSDTKKILAYSTISHCGFLMVLVSFNTIEFTILYLYVHGFFKALVFMGIGNVNRFNKNNQDFKNMGGFFKFLPFDCFCVGLGLINLAGLPFTLGFFIKHLLFISINYNIYAYYFVLTNLILGALTSLFYTTRLFYYVFFDFKKNKNVLYFFSSRVKLNSNYYSNSTLLGTLSIFILFIFAYVICCYLIYIHFNFFFMYSDFIDLIKPSNFFFILSKTPNGVFFNLSLINWLVVIILMLIIFTGWRKTTQEFNMQFFFWVFIYFTLCQLFF